MIPVWPRSLKCKEGASIDSDPDAWKRKAI
jgi:hypothetical protein